MNAVRLVGHQARFDAKRFLRDPAGLFYALGFPLIFLVNFLAVLGDSDEVGHIAGRALPSRYYYLPGVITVAVVSVTFVNLTISLTAARDRGTLQRVHGTPMPMWAFLGGRLVTSVVASMTVVVLIAAAGWVVYDVEIPTESAIGASAALLVATFAFCCLAFAVTAVLPSAGMAAAATMTSTLVLYFLSGLFAREDNLSNAIRTFAAVFPVKRLFQSLAVAYDPNGTGTAIRWTDLVILAAWGFVGLVVALRRFRWLPSPE